jgi:hypothetical protein
MPETNLPGNNVDNCLASDCMAWRWQDYMGNAGYCGLAGEPGSTNQMPLTEACHLCVLPRVIAAMRKFAGSRTPQFANLKIRKATSDLRVPLSLLRRKGFPRLLQDAFRKSAPAPGEFHAIQQAQTRRGTPD